jgi:virginiamycin B lyase
MEGRVRAAAVLLGLSLAACSAGPGTLPPPPTPGLSTIAASRAIAEFAIAGGIDAAPFTVVAGRDGSMWFSEQGTGEVGRIGVHGTIRQYRLPTPGSNPQGLFVDRDGSVYVAEHAGPYLGTHVARISPGGHVTEWNDANAAPMGVARGAGGSIWFTQSCGGLGLLSHGKLKQYVLPGITGESAAIVRAPDGTVWFSQDGSARIGRIDRSGKLTTFNGLYYESKYNDIASAVAAGPDGNLWWTAFESNAIWATDLRGRIVHVYTIPTPNSQPWGIVRGRDGALWFTEWAGNKVGRVTTAGAFTEYPLPTPGAKPQGIARGGDGSIWFVESAANRIGRIAP